MDTGYDILRPSQTEIETITLAPGKCKSFETGALGTHTICNTPRLGEQPQIMNVYVKRMPQWVVEAAKLFTSRGGNSARLEDFTPEEFTRIKEMATFIEQPAPTPNGRIVWKK